MEFIESTLHVESFLTVTLGIIVLFVGKRLNRAISFLREFSIPEPVSGGLLFSLLFTLVYYALGIAVEFDLQARDFLLVYFFTTIGINARLQDLVAGGKPLLILLAITLGYMFLQNLTGVSVAKWLGMEPGVGLLGGTVSLIGGHGTAIAWAPKFAESYGVPNAIELGIASATFGLILASNAINLLIFTVGRLDSQDPPLIPNPATTVPEPFANALPQALILTAIVIGFALLSFIFVLFYRAYQELGTVDTEFMRVAEADPNDRDRDRRPFGSLESADRIVEAHALGRLSPDRRNDVASANSQT